MDIKFDVKNKKMVLLLILSVLLLIAAETALSRLIASAESEVGEKRNQSNMMQSSLSRKSEEMAYYKSNVKLDPALVLEPMESPTKVYGYLLNLVADAGIKDAAVVKAPESPNTANFNISGNDDYFTILNLLVAFRRSEKMMKVTDLTLTAGAEGKTSYSVTVAVMLEDQAETKTAPEQAKEGAVQ